VEFVREQKRLSDKAFAAFSHGKLSVDVSDRDYTRHEKKIADFLMLEAGRC
jgi:hypothetical protein